MIVAPTGWSRDYRYHRSHPLVCTTMQITCESPDATVCGWSTSHVYIRGWSIRILPYIRPMAWMWVSLDDFP